MKNQIFEVASVTPKAVHVILHGSTSVESFKGPPANSIISLWPSHAAADQFKPGKRYALIPLDEDSGNGH